MPGHLQDGFGCVVTNRFDQLLDDESDPFEILKAAENRRKEAAAPGAKPTTTAAAQSAKGPRREPQRERRSQPGPPEKREEPQPAAPPKKDGVRRPGRKQQEQPGQTAPHQQGAPGERRPERRVHRERRFDKPMEEKQEGGDAPVDKPTGERPPRGRGGGRGGRGGRGRGLGRGEGFESRGKREFDRHSGSERISQRAEEKRVGAAVPHTWTNAKDEPSDQSQPAAPETPAEGEEPTAPADSENKENEVEEVKEDSPKEMTLDEWKAMQNKERAKVEFNIRKPNEGDEGQWKKGYVLHKSKTKETPTPSGTLIEAGETNADSVHKVATDDSAADHHIRKPANDITSQLEINFGDLGRPGRGRGGSRGGRGGRGGGNRGGRGGSRSDKGGGASVPNVDDPEAFPALA